MLFIISVMIVGLLWMVYDVINAPTVDDDENPIDPQAAEDDQEMDRVSTSPKSKKEEIESE